MFKKMALKKCTSLAVIAIAASIWIGCSSKEDKAKYDTFLAGQPEAEPTQKVTVVGKYCESGDILAYDQQLPATQPGDILAMPTTGAYGYAMASNYNRNPRPAVVFVENGHAALVVKRESYANLVQLDQTLPENF